MPEPACRPTREAAALAALLLASLPATARAEPGTLALVLPALPPARLIGAAGGGGGRSLRESSGLYLGVDAGWAVMPGVDGAATESAPAFGLHAGVRSPSGLALDLRGDDLGVPAPDGKGPGLATGLGARYTLPLFVLPFVEAHVGAEDYGPSLSVAGEVGAGFAFPVGDHFELDLCARDWIAEIGGAIRHVPVFSLGFTVGFDRGR